MEKIRSGRAECGMLYAVKRSGAAVGYCSLSIKCGTRDEKGWHSGIAHFTEHTIFKGTTKKSASAINNYLDRLGGELNAYTTKEEIVLHATVLKEDIWKAASLLIELATCPTFPESEIETERGVVIEEILQAKDCPPDDAYDRFEENLFKGHPLSKPVLGDIKSVKAITCDELKKFVAEKFQPGAMALTLVADEDEASLEKKALKLIKDSFGTDPRPIVAGVKPAEMEIPEAQKFDITVDKKNHEVNTVIGAIAPSLYEEKDRITAVLLGNILGGPASNSILNNILREKNGWVYGVETSYTQFGDTGVMAICLGCDKNNLSKCHVAIHKEILKLQTLPLSESRLKAAKKQLLGQLAISGDNGESQCLAMGKSLLAYGGIAPDNETKRKIEEITSDDLLNMARRIFNPEKLSSFTIL